MDAALSKSELRRHYRRERRRQGPAALAPIAARLAEVVDTLSAPGLRLGLYWPQASEIDLRPAAQAGGWCLALPAVALLELPVSEPRRPGPDPAAALRYRAWEPGMELVPDRCGIPAPPAASAPLSAAELGLLLIPALAIDRRGIRLGSGGGWYDRLRSDPGWRAVPAIAVLPAACVREVLPVDPWDVPLDGWLDENGLHRLGGPPKVAGL
ncbi:MAG: 5-formyltetrahydrofolate cyclo-ligase [Synechococcaceae cyanobacterium]|nr:5-formyltetrahydrofolate cyclo-ligase [Synechococcaceae cyanobacterium]